MAKRMLLTLLLAGAVLAGLGYVKFRQIQNAIAQGAAFQPPPEAVTTMVVHTERWPETLTLIGTAAAVQGVMVSADLSGIVERIAFDSGAAVNQGDLLVQLDTRQEKAQLAGAEAARDLARLNFERLEGLVSQGAIPRIDYDRAAAEQKQNEAKVGEIHAVIARKTIRAPFTGVLGLRQVNLGQFLSGGDAVVPLQSLNPIYVNFAIPQKDLPQVRVGGNVRVSTEALNNAEVAGKITAINSIVDESTRNVQVQATLENPKGALRPGMFTQVKVLLGSSQQLIAIPATAVSYAPYGDSVFVVTELKGPDGRPYRGVRQQIVKLGPARGDQVAVVSGLQSGEEVVTSGVFKLRNGTAVQVNNQLQVPNQPAPTPEDS